MAGPSGGLREANNLDLPATPPSRATGKTIRRVLLLSPALRSYGGIQTYTQGLYRALQSLLGNDSVRLLAVAEDPPLSRDARLGLRPSVKLRFLAQSLAAAALWRPDLVISLHLGTTPIARLIRRLGGSPYWLVLHGVEVWGTASNGKRRALLDAQRYIALSRFAFESAMKCHGIFDPAPLTLLPPFLPSPPAPTPKLEPPLSAASAEAPIVLTVARLGAPDRFKGVDVMLEAWPQVLERLPSAAYWIVGDGEERAGLEARAQKLGIAGSVRFLGNVAPTELERAYARCAVFAMPARTNLNPASPEGEGFGIVYIEAMSRGKPVLGPRCGAPAEFLRPEFGALADPADPRDVAAALISLLADRQRARACGEAGRQWACRELSYDKFCARLREALLAAPSQT